MASVLLSSLTARVKGGQGVTFNHRESRLKNFCNKLLK